MYAGDPTGGVLREGQGEQCNGKKHTRPKFFHGSKNIQMTAMESLSLYYIVFYFLLKLHLFEETFVARRNTHITKVGLDFPSKHSLPPMFDRHE